MAVKNGKASADGVAQTTTPTETPQTATGKNNPNRQSAVNKFSDPSYNEPISKAAVAQIINNQDPTKVGLFIKENALSLIGWRGEKPNHTHTFGGASEEVGVLLQSPRMNVIQVSPRFIELREDDEATGVKAGTLLNKVYESRDGYEYYEANKDKHVLRRFYFVYVLDENNEKLHETPIAISVKGVASTKLGMALEEFRTAIETAYAAYKGIKKSPKTNVFHRLCVFCPTFTPSHEPKTEPKPNKRSWVAIVDSYDCPNIDGSDFLDYFCEWREEEYNNFVATNPDLIVTIGKAALIAQQHNRLVNGVAGLLPATDVIDGVDVEESLPY